MRNNGAHLVSFFHKVAQAFMTGDTVEETIYPLTDDAINLSGLEDLTPRVIIKGLNYLLKQQSLSIGAATENELPVKPSSKLGMEPVYNFK